LNRFNINKAVNTLQSGGVIAYPTEAVFGLGCDPMNEDAVKKILTIKNRPEYKGLILVASDYSQLEPYLSPLSPQLFDKVMQTWPGPVNWLLPCNPSSPKYLRGKYPLQAVRISNHPEVEAICNQFAGAIVSTSANTNKRPAAKTALQVRGYFSKQVGYVLNGNVGIQKNACEIRNGLDDQIIRPA